MIRREDSIRHTVDSIDASRIDTDMRNDVFEKGIETCIAISFTEMTSIRNHGIIDTVRIEVLLRFARDDASVIL